MCFWRREYTRDIRSLSKYGANGNLLWYLRICKTEILKSLFYSFRSLSTLDFPRLIDLN